MPVLTLWREIVIIVLFVLNIIVFSLWRLAANELDTLEMRGQIQAEQTKKITHEQERITDETAKGWAAALDFTRRDYERRLRNRAGTVPGISQPARSIDAIPSDALPLAAECAETTLMLETLQRWIRDQQKANQ